jgi:hypothetical protein
MTNILIGLILGFVLSNSIYLLLKYLRRKRGIDQKSYSRLPLTTKIADTLSHIVYEYSIKNKNEDFLLNISREEKVLLQVMHRAHFPFLAGAARNRFSMVLYIPISKLLPAQKESILRILAKEAVPSISEDAPIEYHVVDLGQQTKFGSYLISRILKEVFGYELHQKQFDLKLFKEGPLQYFPLKRGFSIE